jgi:hypothetical protein
MENDLFFIFEFEVPKEIINSYNKFIEGKYSEIKEEDKKIVLEFMKKYISLEISIQVMKIFSKSSILREELENKLGMKIPLDIELSSKPNEINETFNILTYV